MDVAALMRLHDIARQQVLARVVARDDARQQIALGGNDFAVFIGVLVQQRRIGLLHQAADLFIQAALFFAGDIAVVAIFNIRARQLLVVARHQLVFYRRLDLVDIHFPTMLHLTADDICDGGAIVCVIDSRCLRRTKNRFVNAR